jgi:glucokinase
MKAERSQQALGIDFGGTFVKMAVVDEHGKVLARGSFSTELARTPDAWVEAVASEAAKLGVSAGRKEITHIGVGVPGFVDHGRGYIYNLPNVLGWKGIPLGERIEKRFGVRVRVDNDVNVMALGECTFGAGRIFQHAVFVTLGTGVGGGLLINNQLYRGAHDMAGEIGHISIQMNGIRSPQGRGGLEQYVGNRQLIARAVRAIKGGRKSKITTLVKGNLKAITPKVIAQAASAGDKLAIEIFDFMADCLATAFASVTYLIQPQVFIVGGGVSKSGEVLFGPLRKHLRERLSPFFAERVEVKPAELGDDAGVIGAATLALMEE